MFGNDFDTPIRDRLPPGFGTALRIVKWAVDPGIEGDVYADKPFLYGNALSSVNALRVGGMVGEDGGDGGGGNGKEEKGVEVVEEGGERGGEKVREELGVPTASDQRKKWFLDKGKTEGWVWENGRVYWCDFFNPYLDFNREFLPLMFFSPLFPISLHDLFLLFSSLSNFLSKPTIKQHNTVQPPPLLSPLFIPVEIYNPTPPHTHTQLTSSPIYRIHPETPRLLSINLGLSRRRGFPKVRFCFSSSLPFLFPPTPPLPRGSQQKQVRAQKQRFG